MKIAAVIPVSPTPTNRKTLSKTNRMAQPTSTITAAEVFFLGLPQLGQLPAPGGNWLPHCVHWLMTCSPQRRYGGSLYQGYDGRILCAAAVRIFLSRVGTSLARRSLGSAAIS